MLLASLDMLCLLAFSPDQGTKTWDSALSLRRISSDGMNLLPEGPLVLLEVEFSFILLRDFGAFVLI